MMNLVRGPLQPYQKFFEKICATEDRRQSSASFNKEVWRENENLFASFLSIKVVIEFLKLQKMIASTFMAGRYTLTKLC